MVTAENVNSNQIAALLPALYHSWLTWAAIQGMPIRVPSAEELAEELASQPNVLPETVRDALAFWADHEDFVRTQIRAHKDKGAIRVIESLLADREQEIDKEALRIGLIELELFQALSEDTARALLAKFRREQQFSSFPARPFAKYREPADSRMAFNAWFESLPQEGRSQISDQDLRRESLYEDRV